MMRQQIGRRCTLSNKLLSEVLTPSSVMESQDETVFNKNQQWYDDSRDARALLLHDAFPRFYKRIVEYAQMEPGDMKEAHNQAQMGLEVLKLAAMPAPSVSYQHISQVNRHQVTRNYTPPVYVSAEEMKEAVKIAAEGKREEIEFKKKLLENKKSDE